jgi:hypothetical protein
MAVAATTIDASSAVCVSALWDGNGGSERMVVSMSGRQRTGPLDG